PVWKSPLFSPWGKLRIALELFVPKTRHPESDESLASFVRRRLGQEALDRLVQPLVGGIYTSDPEKLSVRATLQRFQEMEQQSGSLIRALAKAATTRAPGHAPATGARYGLFATPRLGVGQLVEVLATQVEREAQIHRGVGVTQLRRLPQGFELETTAGTQAQYDAVVLAVPAHRAAELLRREQPAVASELAQIEYASTAIVVTGHRLSDVTHPLDAFGLVIPAKERRKILAVSFTSRKFALRAPEGSVQLRTFVGGAMQPELMERSDEALLAMVRDELTDLLGIRWQPEVTHIARWNRSMPQYHVGHMERAARIEAALANEPHLALAGNALHGVGLPDTISSGEAAAEKVWEGVFPQGAEEAAVLLCRAQKARNRS
ncbi:MAG: protoporphyrinogen oxidase, partial [Planctomycetaceae bacterium]